MYLIYIIRGFASLFEERLVLITVTCTLKMWTWVINPGQWAIHHKNIILMYPSILSHLGMSSCKWLLNFLGTLSS